MGRFLPTHRLAVGAAGLLLGFGALILGGCGSSFVGRQYDNLTAYYNKFYNANQAFEKGVRAFEERDRSIDRTRYLSIFPVPTEGLNEAPFEDAIQKSADVLREHPNSKWVDDALLLIGKSYFFQRNYVGATQKFREVMALNTSRELEARFWLARTLVTSGSSAEASEVLRTGEEGPDNSWTARMRLVEGELLVRQEQWSEAERVLEEGVTGDLPDEVAARAAFLLGQVRETQNAPLDARTAYQQVQGYDPSYELGFAARLSDIELQGEHGDPATALDRLEDLGEDDKNLENRGAIALARARIYRAQGQRERARETLQRALYGDRESRRGASAEGRLHYDLAVLYRDAYKDFSRAAAHFDTASTALRDPEKGEHLDRALPAAPLDAGTQANRFRSLAERAREVAHMDSLLRVGRLSDAEFQAFVKELRRKRQAAREQAEEGEMRPTSRRSFGTSGEALAEQRQEQSPAAQTGESDAGFLFHQDPTRVQEGQRRFEQTWGERPRVDNWRRRIAMRSRQSNDEEPEATPTAGGRPVGPQAENDEAASALDLSAIPRDSASQAAMEADRAVARYELANSLFLAAGRPDSAATWYRRILEETGGQPVARRALYALAEAYRAQGDTMAAQQTYEQLIERHPETELAAHARRRLEETPDPAVENRAVQADSTYDRVLEVWQEGDWSAALSQFLSVAREYPETKAAPRALLASGIIYWRRIQEDAGHDARGPIESFLVSLQSDSVGTVGEDPVRSWGSAFDSTATDSTGMPLDSTGMRVLEWDVLASIRSEDAGSSVGETVVETESEDPDSSVTADTSTVADSAHADAAAERYAPLQGLLTHLTEQYPDTPQAERARSMLDLVREQVQPSDSTATDSTDRPSAPDSAVVAAADTVSDADPRRQKENQSRRPTPSTDSTGTDRASSPEPLPAPTSPSDGGEEGAEPQTWTILVQSFSERSAVMPRMREVEQEVEGRWTVDVRRDPEAEAAYLLLVGRFDSEEQANTVRGQLEGEVSGDLNVQPFSNTWVAP